MEFAEATRYLLSLGHETLAIKLGLTNIILLLEQLGDPQKNYRIVQIAGTNGKGSTAAMLHSICCAARLSTGLFTSPHLTSITERIKIGDQEISQEFFARCATRVRTVVQTLVAERKIDTPPTFFEQVTAIALLAFAEAKVELAILETGLGGRLDATTAAGAEVVGITPISVDHQEYLGETIEQIASEKAAIIRAGCIAVSAKQIESVREVILERCRQTGVVSHIDDCESTCESFTETGHAIITLETSTDLYTHVRLSLAGLHQIANASLALRLAESLQELGLKIDRNAIVSGLENAKHPGRLELFSIKPQILLDGAHNALGAAALRAYFEEFIRAPITLIFGAMRDKQLDRMARLLFPSAKRLVLTQPINPRAATVEKLRELAEPFFPNDRITALISPSEALRYALATTPEDEIICVTGSLYLVGELRQQITSMATSV